MPAVCHLKRRTWSIRWVLAKGQQNETGHNIAINRIVAVIHHQISQLNCRTLNYCKLECKPVLEKLHHKKILPARVKVNKMITAYTVLQCYIWHVNVEWINTTDYRTWHWRIRFDQSQWGPDFNHSTNHNYAYILLSLLWDRNKRKCNWHIHIKLPQLIHSIWASVFYRISVNTNHVITHRAVSSLSLIATW